MDLTDVPTQPSHPVNSSVRNVLVCLTGLHSEEPGMAENVTNHLECHKCPGIELEKNIQVGWSLVFNLSSNTVCFISCIGLTNICWVLVTSRCSARTLSMKRLQSDEGEGCRGRTKQDRRDTWNRL